jgi:glycosyltransferase involved in cell wall biosynthesis
MNSPSLCFDARMAHASGIGTYIQGLLSELPGHLLPDWKISVIHEKNANLSGHWTSLPVSTKIYSVGEQAMIPWVFRKSSANLLHVPHYNFPVLETKHCIVTVHDLIHLKFPEFLPSRAAYAYAWIFFHQFIPKVRAILTVSEHTKKDLVEIAHIPEQRITVTPPGVPWGYHPLTSSDYLPALESLGLRKGYFLYVGNLKEFKNVPRLLQAFRQLKRIRSDAPPLVVVGQNFIRGFDQELRRTESVYWFPGLKRSLLPQIYAGALALIFPSLYEGFGLPPLEAMACGTPVICSNRASLPEVVGEAALLIDPLSLDSLTNAMRRISEDPTLARQLGQKGIERSALFSWKETAEKTADVYEQCLS